MSQQPVISVGPSNNHSEGGGHPQQVGLDCQPGPGSTVAHLPGARPGTVTQLPLHAIHHEPSPPGSISFAAATYRAGSAYRRTQVIVAIVDDHVQIAFEGSVIRTHPIR